ncbi:amino acid ABC transporter permease [Noviherbaspirillum sp. Root189]|uniref:amino acid ABC transporter permease n=1 Tax=Noviherbaspirillum sp. Root189 TaxID=1736487 RepID=UPI000708A26F|nr:amino acid ABC transporter permease [Noviherbaspirillum sp. Root189]KRB70679.1 ABC transporter permease [Noviherbaspirillum sp. Root189]
MTLAARLSDYAPAIASGLLTTAALSAVAIAVGFVTAVGLYIARMRWPRGGVGLVRMYVSFFRGTPLLVQLLMLFYMPTAFGLDLNPWLVAMTVLGMNSAAFQSEILRSGFASIPVAQIEAARVFGLNQRQILWHIQMPQVLRLTLPSLVSESIDIIKGSAVISVLAIADLMRVGKQLVAVTYRPLEVYLSIAAAYLLLTTLVAWSAAALMRRQHAGKHV